MTGDDSSNTAKPGGSAMDAVPAGRRERWINVVSWTMLVACLAGSYGLARGARSIVEDAGRRTFSAASADMGSVVSSTLQRNVDFMATLRTTIASRPNMTNREFGAWIRDVGAAQRYPGGAGYTFIERVPAARLSDFRERLATDSFPAGVSDRRAEILPAGTRPFYCLTRMVATPGAPSEVSFGTDFCATEGMPQVTSATIMTGFQELAESGEFAVYRLDRLYNLFAIVAPVYSGQGKPTTVAERRARIRGWVAGTFEPNGLLAAGMRSHPGMRVEILHQNVGEARPVPLVEAGRTSKRGWTHETTLDAEGPWTVRVTGPRTMSGISPGSEFAIVLAVGSLLSLLVFGFVQVLARGRRRALELVSRRTRQLRHQATHDSLTGLPNRAHTLTQVEAALARVREHQGRRADDTIALMFLDLDEFKAVNDTYGHPCGDELLRAVSTRLRAALREIDVVGRLGGDEFVILLQGAPPPGGPEAMADRLRAVLAEPIVLHGHETVTVRARASIGIAVGPRADADELLRDADLALYEAKQQGKDRYVIFSPRIDVAQGGGPASGSDSDALSR